MSRRRRRQDFGLSPRGRGKHSAVHLQRIERRSIPAWAGETAARRPYATSREVYPRVGGGNRISRRKRAGRRGLSPRGRGKLVHDDVAGFSAGSIPAWAGETKIDGIASISQRVYPRVGGGNLYAAYTGYIMRGLSPRGRGKRLSTRARPQQRRSIPAWAGETAVFEAFASITKVYPRVGGGNISKVFNPGV